MRYALILTLILAGCAQQPHYKQQGESMEEYRARMYAIQMQQRRAAQMRDFGLRLFQASQPRY